jgi:hypothetical protein
MEPLTVLLASTSLLIVILLILVLVSASQRPKGKKIKEDIKKIKDQVDY